MGLVCELCRTIPHCVLLVEEIVNPLWQVQYVLTRDHLSANRNYDCNAARAAKLSAYNEAERVNAEETSTVTKAEVPSLLKLAPPRNRVELQHNRRSFQTAIVNALGTGTYAGHSIISRAATPEVPANVFVTDAERSAARNINAAKPDKRTSMPMARTVLPVLRYKELHGLEGHYHFQVWAARTTWTRLSCPLSPSPLRSPKTIIVQYYPHPFPCAAARTQRL